MSSSQPTSPSAGSSQPPLPKLPKVLSIIANATNCQWQEAEKVYAAQVAMTEVSHSKQGSIFTDTCFVIFRIFMACHRYRLTVHTNSAFKCQ